MQISSAAFEGSRKLGMDMKLLDFFFNDLSRLRGIVIVLKTSDPLSYLKTFLQHSS